MRRPSLGCTRATGLRQETDQIPESPGQAGGQAGVCNTGEAGVHLHQKQNGGQEGSWKMRRLRKAAEPPYPILTKLLL